MEHVLEDPKAIPDFIDHAASTNPNGTWAIVPEATSDSGQEWLHLTFSALANAVNHMAWWIATNVGAAQEDEVIDYMGANDLRYPVSIAAALKAGYTPLLTSPRNSVEGQQSLLRATSCRKLMYSSEMEAQVRDIKHAVPELQLFPIPTLDELVHSKVVSPPYAGRHHSEEDAVCLILHTSGSTGLPKPIRITVGGLGTINAIAELQSEGRCKQTSEILLRDKRPLLAAAPFFHAMGTICIMRSIMCQGTIVRVPTTKALNADLIIQVIQEIRPAAGVFPPSILEDLASTEEGIQALSKLDHVFFGGGPLALDSGNKICKVCTIVSVIGSTEAGFYASLVPEAPEDWPYFRWGSAAGIHMEPAEEGLREMVVKKKDRKYQGIFHTFPEISEWRTKDLFEAHPTKPGLWRYRGRRDDVIVLSNGEKFNPVSTEKLIEGHLWVKGALVVGQGRFQAGLIIEPDWGRLGLVDLESLIDDVWPLVEQANSEAPSHARIYKSKIAVAKRNKPFLRAAKASIMRFATNTLYVPEIEALYSNEGVAEQLGVLDEQEDVEDVERFVKRAFSATIPSFNDTVPDDTDIFNLGADSLGVLSLANAINHALPNGFTITARTIYEHPTVPRLSSALMDLMHGTEEKAPSQGREQTMQAIAEKYTADIASPPAPSSKAVVVLTGSTGSLGNYALELLLERSSVGTVYCLNRSASAEKRQRDSFAERGASVSNFDKAIFLETDFSKKLFGLSEQVYAKLQQSVTHIIHSAWSVDFNLALESYERTHIAGTRRLIDFSLSAAYRPNIVFVSSIASVGNWKGSFAQQGVPETLETVFNNNLPLQQGYGESKHVSSQILALASERTGLRTAVVRAGQLAGPSADYVEAHGGAMAAWNRHEWVPSIIKTSCSLGKIPRQLGTQERVDWVAMDKAAGALVELALGSQSEGSAAFQAVPSGVSHRPGSCDVFHLVNPQTTTWSALVPTIQAFFCDTASIDIETVEYADWVNSLKGVEMTKENIDKFPGLKLLDFYEALGAGSGGLPVLDTARAEKNSETMRGMQAIGQEDMLVWLQGWGF